MTNPTDRLAAALADRYRIERELGAGGMATVYLSQDLKHDRKVAIKVLRPELAAVIGAERFLQEIKTTANLQHPHILPLFDSGTAGQRDGGTAFLYYVMPYVEGETLRDRLDRETQLGIEEAVRITTEVADALYYAHQQGVIHRDIKPENILLHRGRPMVADFGIALAVSAAAGPRLTDTGISLGTPHYMSPEQATAEKAVTARSDVYSLGCVLYEMLAGEPPHTGSSVQAIIMKIVTDEARPVSEVRKTVPAHVAAATARSLEKLPADRFESAAQFAEAINDPAFTTRAAAGEPRAVHDAWRLLRARLVATAVGLVTVTAATTWMLKTSTQPTMQAGAVPTRFTVPVPSGFELEAGQVPGLALSPDGRTLVYETGNALYRLHLDEFESERLDGTEGAYLPFFSHDGEWIGFWAGGFGGTPLRISVDGGPVSEIPADIDRTAWGVDMGGDGGSVVYAAATGYAGIYHSTAGETALKLTEVVDSAGESSHQWPQLLDDGRALLFSVIGPSWLPADSRVVVKDLASGQRTTVATGATFGRYVPTGHVIYVNAEGTLHAIPFDLRRRAVTGDPFPVESGVRTAYWGGAAAFAVSDGGTLAFARGSEFERHLLVWIDRAGVRSAPLGTPLTFETHNLSPDGERIAMDVSRSTNSDIAVTSVSSWQPRRFTLEQAQNESPVWSPEGSRLAYTEAGTGGATRIWIRDLEAGREPFLVHTAENWVELTDWSPDGSWLMYTEQPPARHQDVYAVPTDGSAPPIEVATTGVREGWGSFSANGGLVAYMSEETGIPEVYVVSFPDIAAKQQVSNGGGRQPQWSPKGDELFYLKGDSLMVLPIETGGVFTAGAPRPLFAVPDLDSGYGYAVSPDANRFLVRVRNPDALSKEIYVVTNWFAELSHRGS